MPNATPSASNGVDPPFDGSAAAARQFLHAFGSGSDHFPQTENVKSEPATVHRVLSMIMAYAMKDGRLAVNPAAGVSLPRVREPEKRYLTERPVAELADAVGEEYRLIVLFLAYTGLR